MPLPAVRPWCAAGFCVDWFAGVGWLFRLWLVGCLFCFSVRQDLQSWRLFQRICNLLLPCRPAACGHKHPSQAGRASSWMIWPCGGGALSVAVALREVLRFSRFALYLVTSRRRSSTSGSRNHRATLYCRQAAFLCNRSTEIRFGGSAPLHRCPSLRSGHRPLTAADG